MGINGNGHGLTIVGQPFKLYAVHAVVHMSCRCDGTDHPLVIMGVRAGAQCPACKKLYSIASANLSVDRQTGKVQSNAELNALVPQAEPEKPALVS